MTRSMQFWHSQDCSELTFGNDAKGCFETTFLSPSIINGSVGSNPIFSLDTPKFGCGDGKIVKKW